MITKLKTIALLSIILLLKINVIVSQNRTTFGEEFWLSFMEAGPNGNNQFTIYLSSFDNGIASITSPAGELELEVPYLANSVTEIILPDSIYYPTEYGTVTNFGLKLQTSTEVTAHTSHLQIFQSEASILFPIEIIGTEYIITTASQNSHSYIIVSTSDSTEISLVSFNDTEDITLNEGETYQVFSNSDPSGIRITSNNNKKIAVFSGARMTKMCGSEGGNNHLYDQLLPLNLLGKEYAVIPFAEQGPALYKVLATENNTELLLGEQFLANLNAQESFEFSLEEPKMLKSNEKIQVSQISCHYDSIGDPSLLHLIPTNKMVYNVYVPSIIGFGSMPETFSNRYLNLVTKTNSVNNILVDNVVVDSEFQQIESDSSYSFAHIQIEENSQHIVAPDGVYGYSYGFGLLDAYTFSIGFEEEITTSTKDEKESSCIIFPNPVQDIIHFGCSGLLDVEIYDQIGRIVQKTNLENLNSCEIGHLPDGIFIVKLQRNTGNKITNIVTKIIKN